jgi:hypothetical protein
VAEVGQKTKTTADPGDRDLMRQVLSTDSILCSFLLSYHVEQGRPWLDVCTLSESAIRRFVHLTMPEEATMLLSQGSKQDAEQFVHDLLAIVRFDLTKRSLSSTDTPAESRAPDSVPAPAKALLKHLDSVSHRTHHRSTFAALITERVRKWIRRSGGAVDVAFAADVAKHVESCRRLRELAFLSDHLRGSAYLELVRGAISSDITDLLAREDLDDSEKARRMSGVMSALFAAYKACDNPDRAARKRDQWLRDERRKLVQTASDKLDAKVQAGEQLSDLEREAHASAQACTVAGDLKRLQDHVLANIKRVVDGQPLEPKPVRSVAASRKTAASIAAEEQSARSDSGRQLTLEEAFARAQKRTVGSVRSAYSTPQLAPGRPIAASVTTLDPTQRAHIQDTLSAMQRLKGNAQTDEVLLKKLDEAGLNEFSLSLTCDALDAQLKAAAVPPLDLALEPIDEEDAAMAEQGDNDEDELQNEFGSTATSAEEEEEEEQHEDESVVSEEEEEKEQSNSSLEAEPRPRKRQKRRSE